MRTYEAKVRKRRISHGERCLANDGDLQRIGRAAGHQVRIVRSKDLVALYTVEQPSREEQGTVGMGRAGRTRLGGTDVFDVTVDAQVVDQHVPTSKPSATESSWNASWSGEGGSWPSCPTRRRDRGAHRRPGAPSPGQAESRRSLAVGVQGMGWS